MRAHLRMFGACLLLAGMTVASLATAQEAAPPRNRVASPPPTVNPKPARARPPVTRFDDETPEPREATHLYMPADARTEPSDAGRLVAHLPIGALVTPLASHGSAVLVEFDDPADSSSPFVVVGWVPRDATLAERDTTKPAHSSTRAASPALLHTGIAFIVLGALGTVAVPVFMVVAMLGSGAAFVGFIADAALSQGFLATGIPMVVLGGRQVPVGPSAFGPASLPTPLFFAAQTSRDTSFAIPLLSGTF